MFKQLIIAICAEVKFSFDDQSREDFCVCWSGADLFRDAAEHQWWR